MKQTVEEAAREELAHSYANTYNNNGIFEYRQEAMLNMFIKGAEWKSNQSPWISVEDKLPINQDVVLVRTDNNCYSTAYLHGKESGFITYGEDAYKVFGEITHWMPIPSFDEILESNKDVLERIKEKEVNHG